MSSGFGSRAPYAKARNEKEMKKKLDRSEDFPQSGRTSVAWYHQKLQAIQKGNEWNIARAARLAEENRVTAMLNEEKQLANLAIGRRESLRGMTGKIRGAQRVAEQVINS